MTTLFTAFYELGLAGVLADAASDRPGGVTRDDLLAHVVDQVANELFLDDYELRELLHSDLPLSSDDGSQTGELLVMTRSDNVGGPLSQAEATRVAALVSRVGRSGSLCDPLSCLVPFDRAVLLPGPCLNGLLSFDSSHPLHGVTKLSAVDFLKAANLLAAIDNPDLHRFRELLALCQTERFPVSWRRVPT